ncbi:MAG: hypothetical protein ACR2O6_14375 [Ilumatobacteraceae bacterium]
MAGAAGALIIVTGVIYVASDANQPDAVETIGQPNDGVLPPDQEGGDSDGSSSTVAEQADDQATTAPPASPTTQTPTTAVASTTQAPAVASSTTVSVPTTTTIASSSTTQSPTTTDPGTSPASIETACGTVVVELIGPGIRLVTTEPNPGMEVDIKNSGPEKVEVGFEQGDVHCEVTAENRGGSIWSETDDESSESGSGEGESE